jgi:hypothetical protein
MNFEAISRFHFSPIERTTRSTQETVSLNNHCVSLTAALYERMGKPEYLLFGYDAEEKALGIRVMDEKSDDNVLKASAYTTGGIKVANSKYISNRIAEVMNVDLDKKRIILRKGYKVEDYYVFELRNADVVNKTGRRSG